MKALKTFFTHLMYTEEQIQEMTNNKRFELLDQSSHILKDCETEEEAIKKLNIMLRVTDLIKDSEHEEQVKIMYRDNETCLINYNSVLNNVIVTDK